MAAGVACGALDELNGLIAPPQNRLATVETPSDVDLLAPRARIAGEQDAALRQEFGAKG